MFKENDYGQTRSCDHLPQPRRDLCDKCLGKDRYEKLETLWRSHNFFLVKEEIKHLEEDAYDSGIERVRYIIEHTNCCDDKGIWKFVQQQLLKAISNII